MFFDLHALSKTELYRVLQGARARSQRNWLMYLITYNHGLRASEVIALTPDNFSAEKLMVQRKKGSRRTVHPLVADADPVLSETPAVFEFMRGMHANQKLFPISRITFWRNFHRDAIAAGVDPFKAHPHALKHTIATEVKQQVGLKALQTFLGHKSGASTMIYQDVTEEEAAAQVQAAQRATRSL